MSQSEGGGVIHSFSQQALDASADLKPSKAQVYFHTHLVSDSTGETLNALLKASTAQFPNVRPIEHMYALVRNEDALERVMGEIEAAPGVVMYTIVNRNLRERLEEKCHELQVPAISVLDPVLNALAGYLGAELSLRPGAQHDLDEDYFRRIAALDYTLAHDDGQMIWDLEAADVVLVGISRTSKTPTCMYLAHRGVKAANVPLVAGRSIPAELEGLKQPLVVGLTASPDRLVQIRRSRLVNLNADKETDYVDLDAVRRETVEARKLFAKKRWPMIDVSRRSVEETAAEILTKLSARRNAAD
ncbi:MAG: pyruvate, water dikinase regulatory protein [Pseudomonadota bacterium]